MVTTQYKCFCERVKSNSLKMYKGVNFSRLWRKNVLLWSRISASVTIFEISLKMSLYTSWRNIRGTEVQLHSLLTSAIDRGERSTSRPGRFTPRKEPPYPWREGWVGPRREILLPLSPSYSAVRMFAICDAAAHTAVTTMSTVYYDAMPCILVEIYQPFGQTCCLNLQGRRV